MARDVNLDEQGTYERLDPSGLRGRIAGLPEQCLAAWREGLELAVPREHPAVERVLVAGMGGSGVGGLLLADLLRSEPAPPVEVCREYTLPRYVGRETLVIVSSYSGNTEESLSAFEQARNRGCRVVCIAGGGQLAERARTLGVPLLRVGYRGEPRTALGYALIAPLAVLQRLGLVSDKGPQVEEAASVLRERGRELGVGVPVERNAAKSLATKLAGRAVVVYGAGLLSGVAYRWRSQLNENGKAWAFAEELPEANHNAVEAYGTARAGELAAVMLSSTFLHPRVLRRYEATSGLLRQAGVFECRVEGRGEMPLAHVLSTLGMGDWTSYYLGLLAGVDPSPVPAIERLKGALSP